jgi:hypothetical protein
MLPASLEVSCSAPLRDSNVFFRYFSLCPTRSKLSVLLEYVRLYKLLNENVGEGNIHNNFTALST